VTLPEQTALVAILGIALIEAGLFLQFGPWAAMTGLGIVIVMFVVTMIIENAIINRGK
jgi:hypothetical protein